MGPFLPIVTLQPQSHVAFPGTNVSFYCRGITGSSEKSHLGINNKLYLGGTFHPSPDLVNHYKSRNFTWRRNETIIGNVKESFWELHVIASPINNNTRVKCNFHTKVSNEAVLYVVEGKCIMLATQYLL